MLEGVAPGAYVQGGAALVLLVVTVTLVRWALSVIHRINTGDLVPKATVDELRTQYQERVKEARDDAASWRTVAQESGRQLGLLADSLETVEAFIRALRETRERP